MRHHLERRFGLGAGEPRGAGARQFASLRRLVDVGRAQRIGLDAGLVDQREPARRAGSEHEFRAADHRLWALAGRRVNGCGRTAELAGSLEAVGDAALGQVVGRHLTVTLSPASTRMRFLRMLPAVWAMISCSFSSLTRSGVGEQFRHDTRKFHQLFLRHPFLRYCCAIKDYATASTLVRPKLRRNLADDGPFTTALGVAAGARRFVARARGPPSAGGCGPAIGRAPR